MSTRQDVAKMPQTIDLLWIRRLACCKTY